MSTTIKAICGLAAAALLLPGCAIVRSIPAGSGGKGIAYMLPRALLPVELAYNGSAYVLSIQPSVLVGDTAHMYTLQRSSNVFTSDNYVVNVDAATGLLTSVKLASEDQTIPAITELAGAMKAEAADVVTTVVVFRGMFDPGWTPDQVAGFNQRVSDAAKEHAQRLVQDCKPDTANESCKAVKALQAQVAKASFTVEVEGGAAQAREPADCSAGFCYRINVPHVVTLSGPGSRNSAVFGLPNRSPSFVMPLERWAFVKTTHDVALEGGVFKSITTDRPSSALAVAKAPLDVAEGALNAVANVVQLKINLSGKEKEFAEAKAAEINAKSALEEALLKKDKAEAALIGASAGGKKPLLSIRVGAANQLDATEFEVGVKRPSPKGKQENTPCANNPLEQPSTGGQTSCGNSGNAGDPNP